MQERVGEELGVQADVVDPTQSFESYGLDSITGFTLTCDLADWLHADLPAELLWEYPSIEQLAQHLGEGSDA
jgi:acyl carrier protein